MCGYLLFKYSVACKKYFKFWLLYCGAWDLEKIQSEFDHHQKKILISGDNTTMVHGT